MAKREPQSCGCGCGGMTKGGRFLPGHDARMHGQAKKDNMAAAISHARKITPVDTGVVRETAYRRPKPSTGNGPPCLLNPEHGRLLKIQGVQNYWCPHSDHGGNGRFYHSAEIDGQKAPDPDVPLPKARKGTR
jgi:hypothetical protein